MFPEGTNEDSSDGLQSKLYEQEEKVKNLEEKVANLSIAHDTKLKALQEVETQQKEEIRTLKERMINQEVGMHRRH